MTETPIQTGGYVRHRDRMVQESVFEDLQNTLIACRWLSGTTSRSVVDPNNPSAGWQVVTTQVSDILKLVGQRDDGSLAQLVLLDYFPDKLNAVDDEDTRPIKTEFNTFAVDSGVTGEATPVELGSNMMLQPYLFSMAFYATSDAVAKAVMNDLRDRYQGRIVGDDHIDLYNFNDPDYDQDTTPPVVRMEIDSFRYTQNTVETSAWGVNLYIAELQVTDFVDSGSSTDA